MFFVFCSLFLPQRPRRFRSGFGAWLVLPPCSYRRLSESCLGLHCLRHHHCADYSMARKWAQSATRLILNCAWRLCY